MPYPTTYSRLVEQLTVPTSSILYASVFLFSNLDEKIAVVPVARIRKYWKLYGRYSGGCERGVPGFLLGRQAGGLWLGDT